MAPSVEVDLTEATPPKKMKQARLPFAPLNNQASKKGKCSFYIRKIEALHSPLVPKIQYINITVSI